MLNRMIRINRMKSIDKSFNEILKRSPIRKEEYFEKPPYLDKMTIPNAIALDEKTLIIVSDDWAFIWRTKVTAIENTIEKRIIAHTGSVNPRITPIEIPVRAEWPIESEKKAIL